MLVGSIVTNPETSSRAGVRFYNKRAMAEQWIPTTSGIRYRSTEKSKWKCRSGCLGMHFSESIRSD
jgi:hypothetical protein